MRDIIKDIKNLIELSNGEILDLNKERLYTSTDISNILPSLSIYDYDSAKKLNDRLSELGLIYKHRTGVWDITKKYDKDIDKIVKFESGNIKWTLNGVNKVLNIIEENQSEQVSLF